MLLRKWNYETHKYEEYTTPTEWDCRTYCEDMSEIINCCQCGKKIAFGDTYSSQEVHNFIGLGYSVCEKCHDVETDRRFKNS